MSPCNTPECSQMSISRRSTSECFKRCHIFQCTRRQAIPSPASSLYSFSPENCRDIMVVQHGTRHLDEGTIHPLRNSIRLWRMWGSDLMLDPHLRKKLGHELAVFSTSVSANDLDGIARGCLDMGMEFDERISNRL